MLKYNTMRFLTDEFNPYIRQALLVSETPINLTAFNKIEQFTVQGNEPTGSKRRFMFKADNKVYKFSGQDLVEYTGDITADNVLSSGNTAAQLEAVRNNTALAGKNIYPIIALYTEVDNAPTARIVVNATASGETLDYQDEHKRENFHDEYTNPAGGLVKGKVLDFSWDIDITGDASAGFKVKLLPEEDGEWTGWLTLTEAKGQTAVSVLPKYYYHVDAVDGTNAVKIKYFYIHWSPDYDAKVFGDDAYIVSTVKNFGLNLSSCVLVVRYEPLDGGSVSADVCFQKKHKSVTDEVLGYIHAGTYTTAHKFLPSTLKVYVNGNVAEDFNILADNQHFYVAESRWASGPPWSVSCSYQYDADDEEWLPMTADEPEPTDNGLYTSRFFLKNTANAKQLAAIRIKLSRGHDTKTATKTATGSEQRIKFAHYPDSITVAAADNSESWDFDYDTNELVLTATAGVDVNISYTWHGQTPVITGWAAAFTA